MASTTALFTGLSGLNAHARRLDVIGNNISNVNTVAFKSSRLAFQNQFPIEFRRGAPPGERSGGTNPSLIGLGVALAGTQRDFRVGALSPTGDPRDLAVDGDGLFVVRRDGQDFYTRNGAFRLDANDQLVTVGGEVLQGYTVNDAFQVQQGFTTSLTVPVGKLRIAQPSTRLAIAGNINAGGDAALTGGITTLRADASNGLRLISGAATFGASPPAEKATLLTDLADPALGAPTTPLFTVGQIIEIDGAQRGGRTVPAAQLEVTATTTVADVLAFFESALGIHSLGVANPDGGVPGAQIDETTGVITIVSNTGLESDVLLEATNIRTLNPDGSLARLPFVAADTANAAGEAARTTLVAYDSLGNVVTFDVTFTLLEKNGGNGTVWRYDFESTQNAGGGLALASGTVQFDAQGRLVNPAPLTVAIGRTGTGAVDPLVLNVDLTGSNGALSALTDTPSEFGGVFRNGLPAGTLERWGIEPDGRISGAFSNGAVRTLGQIVLARVTNAEGLVDLGGGLYGPGGNTGLVNIVRPGELAAGEILSGVLELSNVDLGQEFINLILTSTGYSASSRVIRTTDELMQQLLLLGR